jgi:hypothetical protein
MAIHIGKYCPFCGVFIKPSNFEKHLQKKHPKLTNSFSEITVSGSTCPICGKTNNPNRNELPICEDHYVVDARAYMIKNQYYPLKKENDTRLNNDIDVTFHVLQNQLNAMFQLLSWEPESISENQFMLFNEASFITGYLILRIIEAIPNSRDFFKPFSNSKPPSQKMRTMMDELIYYINAEFELYSSLQFASGGFFDIATEGDKGSDRLWIIPKTNPDAIKNTLLMRMSNANEQWHGTFNQFIMPSNWKTARDEFGTSVSFDTSIIESNFESYLNIFNDYYESDLKISYEDYENINEWIKWVVSFRGITQDNYSTGIHFDSYSEFGLEKSQVFMMLEAVLINPYDKMNLVGPGPITSFTHRLSPIFQLADIARGFMIPSESSCVYYFPCREWFYNRNQPVFVKFARELGLMGDSFEADIQHFSTLYSELGMEFSEVSPMGVMFKPRLGEKIESRTSRGTPWEILESTYEFTLNKDEWIDESRLNGEIDLIVYANMNLYLIELKARNLEARNTSNYYRNDAPYQCARYAAWVRSGQFDSFLESKSLDRSKINSVRILICSSGLFKEQIVSCEETGEDFAIVPEYLLFSIMAGVFSMSLKNPFPSRIEQSFGGMKIGDRNIGRIVKINNDYNIGVKLSERLTILMETLLFDRREIYDQSLILEKLKYAPAMNMLGTTHVTVEGFIGDTVSWILDQPFLVAKDDGYSFYVGTQIATVGTTRVCDSCKSVIKYYWGEPESETANQVEALLKKNICGICGNQYMSQDDSHVLSEKMTLVIAKFKHEQQLDFG